MVDLFGISVVILTKNEQLHLKRCIDGVRTLTTDIFVVDSFSDDKTLAIAHEFDVLAVQNKFINHAQQFNWALENLPIKTNWVLRLDADEYLTDDLINEIKDKLPHLDASINGVVFKRRHYFLDKWIKRGTYPVKLLRLFKYKKAVCEDRWMDEHIVLLEGQTVEFENDFVDHNLNNLSWWSQKHIGYSIREAIDLLDIEFNIIGKKEEGQLTPQALEKRNRKLKYAEQPLFLRSFFYFIYRYLFKLGFLEGKEGFLWHFLQGWWYRTLVDAKIYEIKKACGNDPEKIKEYLRTTYNIQL
jgi:glycosyltransferase involved in cell wall biosynthesis